MKQNAFVRLAAINPVPASDRDVLKERLREITPALPSAASPKRRRMSPRFAAVATVVVLGISGAAAAASWGPLSGIGSAQRPAEPADALSPATEAEIRNHAFSPSGAIGTGLVGDARLLGELPDGRQIHIVPTSKSKLCVVATGGAEACYPPLSRENPITLTVSKPAASAPHLIWGVAIDGVTSVAFEVGGQVVTVPVNGNFYSWSGQPTESMNSVSSVTVTYSDGTTQRVP